MPSSSRSMRGSLCSDPARRVLLMALGLTLLFPIASARADIGPKPSMEFTFEYQIDPVPIVEGELIECQDEACEEGQPLQEAGPQGFRCEEDTCSSLAYGYAPYHKLRITFADRVRESNVFTKRAFDAVFRVTVSESALLVEEVSGGVCGCCPGLLFTLVVETFVASLYLSVCRLPRLALGWVPLASLLSLPVVWLVFPRLPFPAGLVVGLSELFAVVSEAGLIYLAARRTMPLKHAAVLSLVMNSASFAFGLLAAHLV